MIPLLIHSDSISEKTRSALLAVKNAAPDERPQRRVEAARALYNEGGLDCDEAKSLVGLADPTKASC